MARKGRYKRTKDGKASRLACDILSLIDEVGDTKLKDFFRIFVNNEKRYISCVIPSKRQLALLLKLADWYNDKADGYERIKRADRAYLSFVRIGNIHICEKRNKFFRIRKQYKDYLYVVEWARKVCMKARGQIETKRLSNNFLVSLSVIFNVPYYIIKQLASNLAMTKSNKRIKAMDIEKLSKKVIDILGEEKTAEAEKEITDLCRVYKKKKID